MTRLLISLLFVVGCACPKPPVAPPQPPPIACAVPAITPYVPVHLECAEFPQGYCAKTSNAVALQKYMNEVAAVEAALAGCPFVLRPPSTPKIPW